MVICTYIVYGIVDSFLECLNHSVLGNIESVLLAMFISIG